MGDTVFLSEMKQNSHADSIGATINETHPVSKKNLFFKSSQTDFCIKTSRPDDYGRD